MVRNRENMPILNVLQQTYKRNLSDFIPPTVAWLVILGNLCDQPSIVCVRECMSACVRARVCSAYIEDAGHVGVLIMLLCQELKHVFICERTITTIELLRWVLTTDELFPEGCRHVTFCHICQEQFNVYLWKYTCSCQLAAAATTVCLNDDNGLRQILKNSSN